MLAEYRAAKKRFQSTALSHETIADISGDERHDWNQLLSDVTSVPPGKTNAKKYEEAIENLITALFYPSLVEPRAQSKIHNGRKIVDIRLTNVACDGFFSWLGIHYKAPYVFVECKNYSGDPANPELDQLSGRFSDKRGRFGILICRKFVNKDLFLQRCIDTAKDDRGYIVALDDGDLKTLADAARTKKTLEQFELLKVRFGQLVS